MFFLSGYGMTEMTACAATDYYNRKKKPGSSGFLIANTIAKVGALLIRERFRIL